MSGAWASSSTSWQAVYITDLYKVPDAVPPIHAVSSHVATDKGPSKFRSIFSDNLQPIATRGKKTRGTLLVNIGCSSKRAPLSVSYYNKISGGHIGSWRCSEEGLCRSSTAPVVHRSLQIWIEDLSFQEQIRPESNYNVCVTKAQLLLRWQRNVVQVELNSEKVTVGQF